MYDPMEFIIDVGRCESNIENPPALPFSNLTLPQFVSYWESIGISFNDGVILMGSHSILEDGTNRIDGVQQYEWSNKYYQDSMLGNTTVTQGFVDCLNETGLAAMDDATEGPAAVLWSAGNWQYTVNDAFIAPNYAENKCLSYFESTEEDLSNCPYKDMVKKYRHFARSLVSFNTDYPVALRRLSTINAKYSVKNGVYILEGSKMTLF